MPTGEITKFYPPEGNKPGGFYIKGADHRFTIWPERKFPPNQGERIPSGFAQGAVVDFQVEVGQYNGKDQYTAYGVTVREGASVGSGSGRSVEASIIRQTAWKVAATLISGLAEADEDLYLSAWELQRRIEADILKAGKPDQPPASAPLTPDQGRHYDSDDGPPPPADYGPPPDSYGSEPF